MMKIVLADDHPIVRLGIRTVLERHGLGCVVAEAGTPSELMEAIRTHPCDVVITDFCMPDEWGRDGLSLVERLSRLYPSIPIIVITALRNVGLLQSALQQGARGLLDKESDISELSLALQAVNRGGTYVNKEFRKLLRAHRMPMTGSLTLTPAEMEILRLFVNEGLSSQQIAERLHRSRKTISRHKRSAQAKLGLHTNQQLVDYCRQVDLNQRR